MIHGPRTTETERLNLMGKMGSLSFLKSEITFFEMRGELEKAQILKEAIKRRNLDE